MKVLSEFDIIRSFQMVKCSVLKNGIRKIAMDYYYCRECDKEEKFPMCEPCMMKCHNGHVSSEKHPASISTPQRCNCALSNHQITNLQIDEKICSCYFFEINTVSQQLYCYQNSSNKRICQFCYSFCKTHSTEEEEFLLQFDQIVLSQDEANGFNCQCPSFKNSKHKTVDFMFKCLCEINSTNESYFPHINPVELINIFFSSKELFDSIIKGFVTLFDSFLSDKIAQNSTNNFKFPLLLSQTYSIFSKNATNCGHQPFYFFVDSIAQYYSSEMFRKVFSNLGILALNNKVAFQSNLTFYESFLIGYKTYYMYHKLSHLPKLKLLEFLNFNPFQRLILQKKTNVLFDIESLLSIFKYINRCLSVFSLKLLMQLFNIIKLIARNYCFTHDSILEFCKILEIFFINFENIREESIEPKLSINIFIALTKILIYFSFFYNDQSCLTILTSNDGVSRNSFIFTDNEVPRIIAKNLIHITHFIEMEYKKIGKDEQETYDNYLTLMSLAMTMIDLGFGKNDVYLNGMKRLITSNSCDMVKEIIDNVTNYPLLNTIKQEEEQLINCVLNYYTVFNNERQLQQVIKTYETSLNNILDLFKINYSPLIHFDAINSNSKLTSIDLHRQELNYVHKPKNSMNSRDFNKTMKHFLSTIDNRDAKEQLKQQEINIKLHLFDLNYYLVTITKVFPLTNQKDIFPLDFCHKVLHLLSQYISIASNHSLSILTHEVLTNLAEMPNAFLEKVFSLIIQGIKAVIKEKRQLHFGYGIFKSAVQLYKQKTNLDNQEDVSFCMWKLIKIGNMLVTHDFVNKKQMIHFLEEHLMNRTEIRGLVRNYKEYLIAIANDFNGNIEFYKGQKDHNNPEIFREFFPQMKMGTTFKIFYNVLALINDCFNDNYIKAKIEFLSQFFSAKELIKMLTITTLNIHLRVQLIQFFRMNYIDVLLDHNKLASYRTEFQTNIEEKLIENLFSMEQSKIFKFYEMIMNVTGDHVSEEEYNFFLFETTHVEEIIEFSSMASTPLFGKTPKFMIYLRYFEKAMIIPLIIYLNKIFAVITTFNGEELLKFYRLAYYILQMIKIYQTNYSLLIDYQSNNLDYKNVKRNCSLTLSDKASKTLQIDQINEDLELMTSSKFSPMNYFSVYLLIAKHLMPLLDNHNARDYDFSFGEYKQEEENIVLEFKEELLDLGMGDTIFETKQNHQQYSLNEKIYRMFLFYTKNKFNYATNSFKENLDLNFVGDADTYRTVLSKFLLFVMTCDYDIYSNDATGILLDQLIRETTETQSSIIELCESSTFTHMRKIIDNCFINILSTIISQFNPSLLQYSNDYYNSCTSIKVLKFLCEEHNQYFQRYFLKHYFFSLNDIQKISFYDMMLYILEKIIILSCWEQVKQPEDFHNYFFFLFSCLIEMLIEIIQGTEDLNFLSLINQTSDNNQKLLINVNRMDPVLKKGKAFESFLRCVKNLVTCDEQYSEEIDMIKKLLMDFFLAFIEEYRCPMEIKRMIIINFHASNIVKSVSSVLKKVGKNFLSKNQSEKNEVNVSQRKLKKRTTIILLDSQKVKKSGRKKTEKIYFNELLYKGFHQLYLSDESFCESSSFQLCCTMYNYFKLTLLQCKDDETENYWNKINSLKEEDIGNFNQSTNNGTFNSEKSDYEAYYVFKLFEKISKSVLVKVCEDKPPIYIVYTKPPCLDYLSEQTKVDFLSNVNRTSRNTKLIELMEQTEYFEIEAKYNWNELRNSRVRKTLTWINYFYFSVAMFSVDFCLNVALLAIDHESGLIFEIENKPGYDILRGISIAFCVLVFFSFLVWSWTKIPLYSTVEKAKYVNENQMKAEDVTCYQNCCIFLRAFLSKGELTSLLLFFLFRILGSVSTSLTFFYSFSLLSVVNLNDNLKNLSMSIFFKGRQLLWVTIFTLVVLYIYAGWGFYYLRDLFYDTNEREKPEQMCESLAYCFFTLINNGFRWYPGVGKVLRTDSALLHPGLYIHNYFYHFLFYWIIRVMMLKIVFGIILDSFRELRELKSNIDKDWRFKCFICNIEKDECEKRNKDFDEHCGQLHNVWDYANFMIYLRMVDAQDLNGVNSMCREMILDRQMQWIPDCEKDVNDSA